jgi:hypothetical protein
MQSSGLHQKYFYWANRGFFSHQVIQNLLVAICVVELRDSLCEQAVLGGIKPTRAGVYRATRFSSVDAVCGKFFVAGCHFVASFK